MAVMKVVKKESPGKGISISSASIPVAGPDEVLIKVKLAGICGTDLHIFKWDNWSKNRIKLPLIIGHEFVGEIVDIGSNVKHLRKGQRVSGEGHITCGHCRYCQNGRGHICQDVKIIGVDMDGCFAEYISIPARNIWPVHEAIPDRYAALFDPLGNAMHTVMTQPVAMKTILITGAGAIGLFAITIAKVNGAEKIIVVEPNSFKRELAVKVGADFVFDSSDDDIKEKIMDITEGNGPDIFLEMSGNPGALRMGLDLLSNGGTASLLGIPEREVPINIANEIIFKGITIHGIVGRRMFETWYQCQSFLLRDGKSIDPVVTHTVSIDNIEDGFHIMENNMAGKVVVEIGN
ncbi:MAG: L-threonine 3-dehydrogenase [Firmicutes bacterium]|nr:L-threonine 3-dehydrogenase [Bacillota bacterium]